jgi:phosphoribosylanthranilate isomerase
MTLVKICGLKRQQDADIMNEYLPDYIGFIFAKSRRQVDKLEARRITQELDPAITRVGVFVNSSVEEIDEIADFVGLDVVQLHADTDPEYFEHLKATLNGRDSRKHRIWQRIAIPADAVHSEDVFQMLSGYPALSGFEALLFDTVADGRDGGSGVSFPEDIGKAAVNALRKHNDTIIIAGGINAKNVSRAISMYRPYAVDVSSAVEKDGFKDRDLIRQFIEEVRGKGNEK